MVDKPLIQDVVEEVEAAGITEYLRHGPEQARIEDHFDKAYELESQLAEAGEGGIVEVVQKWPKNINAYIRQPEALGLGHAVLCAYPAVGDEPFAVVLADDLLDGDPGLS